MLDLIFGYCSVKDLKSCRQVCKLWKSSALKSWKSMIRVNILPEGSCREAAKFLELTENESKIFAYNFVVCQMFPISWMEFLAHFPFLEDICVQFRVPNSIDDLFKAINLIREQHPDKLQLKSIEDCSFKPELTEIRPGLLSVLLDQNINLEKLYLDVYQADTKNIRAICNNHFASLKVLSIDKEVGAKRFVLNPMECFPQNIIFENLQELVVESIFSSMEFLQLTPNLQTLVLGGKKLSSMVLKTDISLIGSVVLTNCKILRVCDKIKFEALRILMCWVPNVKRLNIKALDNDNFELVCGRYSNLIELGMTEFEVDDCGFTGMSRNDVNKINRKGTTLSWRPANVTRSNLSDLKSKYTK